MTKGSIPSARWLHGSAVIEDNLYIFGAFGSEDDSLYCFNTNLTEWVDIPMIGGSPPQPRRVMSMFSFEKKLYVFGGVKNKDKNASKDFYEFNLKTGCWSKLSENH
jgi:N-acetylneuraminic acid mutarotase